VDEGNKSGGFNWIKIVLMAGVIIIGVVKIYRGKAGIVEKVVLIGIVVFVMMAPFRYSQASRGVVFYYHNDHLNTPVKMTDEKGNVVWEVVSKHPFGSFEVSSKEVVLSDYTGNSNDSFNYKIENPIRFPGQYDDSDTKDVRSLILNNAEGLYYNYHRWYNPDTGRYMEVDPYKIIYFSRVKSCYSNSIIQKTRHRYLYAMNNPIIILDISGLNCRNVNKCMTCFRISGSDRLNDALSELIGWDCDPYGDYCPEYETEHWLSAPHRCCGYAVPGSGWVTMTNVPMSDCDRDCFVLLHEIAHAVIGLEDDDDADSWARFNLPDCCDLVGGR